jgi:hypothetical protein
MVGVMSELRMAKELAKAYALGQLPMITIYDHPADCPGDWVARLFLTGSGMSEPMATNIVLRAKTLDELREMLPAGLHRLPRQAGDMPSIVETWM